MAGWYSEMIKEFDCSSEILNGERRGFLFTLMVLSSYAMQADGRVMHSELEFLRDFLLTYFGEEKKERYEKVIMHLFTESKKYSQEVWREKVERCIRKIVPDTTAEQRLLLLAFFIKIVRADHLVENGEVDCLAEVATWLEVSEESADKIEDLRKEVASWEN